MNAVTPRKMDTQKMVNLALLAAIAYVVMLVGRVPVVLFLKYDPKDVVIAIGGFIYGPMAAFGISLVVSFVEMLTTSTTGPIGFVMNVLSSCAFSCTAAVIYKRNKSIKGAIAGLIAGALLTTAVMMLWNYLITPLYMKVEREYVKTLLIPAFLPFNLLKGGLNAGLTMLLYKPLVSTLRKMHLIPESESATLSEGGRTSYTGILLLSGVVVITCILAILVMKGLI